MNQTPLTITQLQLLLKIYNGITPGEIDPVSAVARDLRFLTNAGLIGFDGALHATLLGCKRVMFALEGS